MSKVNNHYFNNIEARVTDYMNWDLTLSSDYNNIPSLYFDVINQNQSLELSFDDIILSSTRISKEKELNTEVVYFFNNNNFRDCYVDPCSDYNYISTYIIDENLICDENLISKIVTDMSEKPCDLINNSGIVSSGVSGNVSGIVSSGVSGNVSGIVSSGVSGIVSSGINCSGYTCPPNDYYPKNMLDYSGEFTDEVYYNIESSGDVIPDCNPTELINSSGRCEEIKSSGYIQEDFNEVYNLLKKPNLFFYPKTGCVFNYDYNISNDKVTLNGGYFKSFYDLYDYKYNKHPNRYLHGFGLEFIIKPTLNSIIPNTLNSLYEDNHGIIFYKGLSKEYVKDYSLRKITREISPFLYYNNAGNVCCRSGVGKIPEKETGHKLPVDQNPFLFYNSTEEGCKLIKEVVKNEGYDFVPYDGIICDLIENGFSIAIKDDGSIEYKHIELQSDDLSKTKLDCKTDNINIITIKSKTNIIKPNIKQHLYLDFTFYGDTNCNKLSYNDLCNIPPRDVEIKIYVDGKLVDIINGFKEIIPKEMGISKKYQFLLPYNINIGGGTSGVLEDLTIEEYTLLYDKLLLTREFSGTFIGDIYYYSLYDRPVDYSFINNRYKNTK